MYRKLEAEQIVETLETLERRVGERFPGSGLASVCSELVAVARQAHFRCAALARPDFRFRALLALVMLLGLSSFAVLVGFVVARTDPSDELFETLSGIDAAFNILVLLGASLFFMVRLEERRKQTRALSSLHELRSIIHVIDMHQLTKDPSGGVATSSPTPSSPKRVLTPQQVVRYLDYCSEMLSLTSKVAALYAQGYPNPVVAQAVTDIEQTATGLSQKIWQKVNITLRTLG